ncbi:Zinc finger CCCH domain-containing protein 13 [Labeo rohita]|uniref:Zinc finger CCCH domain-containing protein 13 n=1 Tax=Labeo rohita TaxID=84645 RepID=A0ABQ8LYP3_LABRO|nr:Zinc finger CCCH domain-containing protein 13 [Labeo rohita]
MRTCPLFSHHLLNCQSVLNCLSCCNHRGHSLVRCASGVGSRVLMCMGSTHHPRKPLHSQIPTHSLLPPPVIPASLTPAPLLSVSPYPLMCVVGSLRVCQPPSVLWLEDPLFPPLASESQTPHWPIDLAAPPWLLVPFLSAMSVSTPASPGSVVPSAPPWSVVDHPPPWDSTSLAALHPSIPLALLGSSFPLALPWLSVALAPSDLHLCLGRRSHLLCLGPLDPLRHPGSFTLRLRLCSGLLSHLLHRCRSSPWSRQPFLHHGSSLCRLHRGSHSWLWPGSPLAPPASSPSCLLPGSSLRLIHLGSYCLRLGSSLHLVCRGSSGLPWLSAYPLPSPVTIPHSLLCPPPKSPPSLPF